MTANHCGHADGTPRFLLCLNFKSNSYIDLFTVSTFDAQAIY